MLQINFSKDFQNIFKNIKEKSLQSEISNNIRKYTEEAFKEIDKLLTEARTRFEEVKVKAEEALNNQEKK